MRIGEVAEKTGLNISNIRFYERKGLIGPSREKDSKYRDYSNEDLVKIKEIILLRKMDLSIDDIGNYLNKEQSLTAILNKQVIELQEKQKMLQESMELCSKILNDGAPEALDVDYYLNYVKTEEAAGHKFPVLEEVVEDFASFTQLEQLLYGSAIGGYLIRNNLLRPVMMIWLILFTLIPIAGIVDDIINGISVPRLIFWCLWICVCIYSFVSYRRKIHKTNG